MRKIDEAEAGISRAKEALSVSIHAPDGPTAKGTKAPNRPGYELYYKIQRYNRALISVKLQHRMWVVSCQLISWDISSRLLDFFPLLFELFTYHVYCFYMCLLVDLYLFILAMASCIDCTGKTLLS